MKQAAKIIVDQAKQNLGQVTKSKVKNSIWKIQPLKKYFL
jgi:hypothetical protein